MLTLYQAEWCPYSSAVRELLTEHGIDYIVRQVEPWPPDRARLQEVTGGDGIPVLEDEQGQLYHGLREIFAYIATLETWPHAADHRVRYHDHQEARSADATGRLLEHGP
jgi:glutaredoxin